MRVRMHRIAIHASKNHPYDIKYSYLTKIVVSTATLTRLFLCWNMRDLFINHMDHVSHLYGVV